MRHTTGGYKVTYHSDGPRGQDYNTDFTPPFQRFNTVRKLKVSPGGKTSIKFNS
jgi:lysyl-tRNA synthetase class 2